MTVKVANEEDLPFLREPSDILLGEIDSWVESLQFSSCGYLIGFVPSSVQIIALETATIVSYDDPIYVHHRDNLEDEICPQ
jgi:hypothetical protein